MTTKLGGQVLYQASGWQKGSAVGAIWKIPGVERGAEGKGECETSTRDHVRDD